LDYYKLNCKKITHGCWPAKQRGAERDRQIEKREGEGGRGERENLGSKKNARGQ